MFQMSLSVSILSAGAQDSAPLRSAVLLDFDSASSPGGKALLLLLLQGAAGGSR